MGALADAARKICDDCGADDRILSWSRDGHTRICRPCRELRGDREIGAPSALALNSMAVEAALAAGNIDAATRLLGDLNGVMLGDEIIAAVKLLLNKARETEDGPFIIERHDYVAMQSLMNLETDT